ncbi:MULTISPECIES: hypothetical protein [unclassified Archaeoglobus]|nr:MULTISPECIES: hypothetical protein [unclassified Archaeoglobus]
MSLLIPMVRRVGEKVPTLMKHPTYKRKVDLRRRLAGETKIL